MSDDGSKVEIVVRDSAGMAVPRREVARTPGDASPAVATGPVPQHLALLGDDADAVLERATKIAKSLAAAIRGAKLAVRIQGREYVRYEGWTTLAAMLRLCPRVSARRLDRAEEIAYEATCDLVAVDSGARLYSADAICSTRERAWAHRDEYAIRSMAQTRATAKACRTGLSFVMALAGYEVTPAEEMPRDAHEDAEDAPARSPTPAPGSTARPDSPPDPRVFAHKRMTALGWTPERMTEFARVTIPKASSHDYTPADWQALRRALDEEEERARTSPPASDLPPTGQ